MDYDKLQQEISDILFNEIEYEEWHDGGGCVTGIQNSVDAIMKLLKQLEI